MQINGTSFNGFLLWLLDHLLGYLFAYTTVKTTLRTPAVISVVEYNRR